MVHSMTPASYPFPSLYTPRNAAGVKLLDHVVDTDSPIFISSLYSLLFRIRYANKHEKYLYRASRKQTSFDSYYILFPILETSATPLSSICSSNLHKHCTIISQRAISMIKPIAQHQDLCRIERITQEIPRRNSSQCLTYDIIRESGEAHDIRTASINSNLHP